MDMKIVQTYTQDKNGRYSNMLSKEEYIIFLDFKQLVCVRVCVCVCVCIYTQTPFMKLERIFILFVNHPSASM